MGKMTRTGLINTTQGVLPPDTPADARAPQAHCASSGGPYRRHPLGPGIYETNSIDYRPLTTDPSLVARRSSLENGRNESRVTSHESRVRSPWSIVHGLIAFALIIFVSGGCGNFTSSGGENYGDIFATAEGIVLTEAEHGIGWGESNCLLCHRLDNIHLVNRSNQDWIDIDAMREEVEGEVASRGSSACVDCHGTNGVE